MEFAVDNISDIEWNDLSFRNLAIPEDRKKLVRALAASHANGAQFDDFVPGKGRGLIMLLQYELRSALYLEKTNAEHQWSSWSWKDLDRRRTFRRAAKAALHGMPCLFKLLLFA